MGTARPDSDRQQGAVASGSRYNYDAYGVSLGSQPSTLNPPLTSLLYTGGQFDTGLQQYCLWARYFNQSTGRFHQLDPFAGNDFDPQSLHKYLDTHADPINATDPTGLMPVWAWALIIGLSAAFLGFLYGMSQAQQKKQTGRDWWLTVTKWTVIGFCLGYLV